MIDAEAFRGELAKLTEWDTQSMKYGYEVDVEYINGRMLRNESGTRRSGAGNFQSDVERIARDARVGRIFVRLYRGVSGNAKRMDPTRADGDVSPDIVLRVNSDSNVPPIGNPDGREIQEGARRGPSGEGDVIETLGAIMGMGRGLSGLEAINGIMDTRINSVRRELENAHLQERYEEARARETTALEEVARLQRELDRVEGERDELLDRVEELKRFDPRTGEGAMGLALNLGSMALGRAVKSFATQNPQRFSGLFGADMLEMFSGGGPRDAPPTSAVNPKVEEISSWLNMQSEADVERVYRLVTIWDGHQGVLASMADQPGRFSAQENSNEG